MKLMLVTTGIALAVTMSITAYGQAPAELNDLEIAHVAYVADNIDIRYAYLALALSDSEGVRNFAGTMIRHHTSVNEQALALLEELDAQPQDNFLSRSLIAEAEKTIDEMSRLRGSEFDRYYAKNELEYHRAVNGLITDAFIPNIENGKVKALFEEGLKIFKAHESSAESLVKSLPVK